jgi:penicillin-binding protein 1B
MSKTKIFFIAGLSFLTLIIISGVVWAFQLEKEMLEKMKSKKFLPPTEYYAAPITVRSPDWNQDRLLQELKNRNYSFEKDGWGLPGTFRNLPQTSCIAFLTENFPGKSLIQSCLLLWLKQTQDPALKDLQTQIAFFDRDGEIISTWGEGSWSKLPEFSSFQGGNFKWDAHLFHETPSFILDPQLLGQYLNQEPIMQKYVSLGQIPPSCLNAVMSIEDKNFLEHSGVSLTSIGRAFLRNMIHGRLQQGGSTITQQLVKNYFLSSEKTLRRKAQEFIMSLILENHSSKDEILETYLNIIYLGQNGSFQVRGYGSAAQHYFSKPISDLNTHECALLAAIVNSPGLFDPWKKPQNALKRRNLVLEKMRTNGFLTDAELTDSKSQALPASRPVTLSETAPYFIQAAQKQMQEKGFPLEGLSVFTSLNSEHQKWAQESLESQLQTLEKERKNLAANKSKGLLLEGVVLSVDNNTGLVSAGVGGRNFRVTQFNRILNGHRQVGSVMKPVVYLSALLQDKDSYRRFHPLTELQDEPTEIRYENKIWNPDNYDKKYFGNVPMYFALKNSLNAATVQLGMQVGLSSIEKTARQLGIQSNLNLVPSLLLGSFELYPLEVLNAYTSFARFGSSIEASFVRSALHTESGKEFIHHLNSHQNIDSTATAILVGMMKQAALSGTAKQLLINYPNLAQRTAGKTGTTSDNKDAWFLGFTPRRTSLVWVGYDNNTPHGLTGASAAVPVWGNLMNKIEGNESGDFAWPNSVQKKTIQETIGTTAEPALPVELIFAK